MLDPLLFLSTLRVVRRYRIPIIHAHHYEGLLVGLAVRALTGAKVVYDAHTLLGEELSSYAPRLLRRSLRFIGKMMDETLPGRADHVIPVTEDIYDVLATRGETSSRMTVVGNGIETDVEPLVEQELLRQPNPVPERIVFAGNLAAYQGVSLLLDAFSRVAARRGAATTSRACIRQP